MAKLYLKQYMLLVNGMQDCILDQSAVVRVLRWKQELIHENLKQGIILEIIIT